MIVARTEVIRAEMDRRGWTDLKLAVELEVSLNTAKALLAGDAVGSKTISSALRVFAPLGFEELFTVAQREAVA